MTLDSGTRLGPYEIVARLAAGGMGEVFRARDTKLDRDVAVKVLPEEVAGDAQRRARFEQEARAASALNHPAIIHIYDIGQEGSTLYLAMELVEGRTLRDLLSEGPVPVRKALEIGEQVAAGLARAHAADIVHRDLKPENLMVTPDGLVKIVDFGLAKRMSGGGGAGSELATAALPETGAGMVLGTAGYMAPEQARGGEVDFRTDQFALGAVLYEVITGVRAFHRESFVQTLAAIIEDEPEPLSRHHAKAPPHLQWILDRCLAKDPADRYASTLDLARDLRQVKEHLSEAAPVPAGLTASAPRRRGGLGILAVGILVGAILGAALPTLRWWEADQIPPQPPKLSRLTFSGFDAQPAASPDGRMLAFVSNRDGTDRVWLRQLADGAEVPLTDGLDSSPRFSPDGSMVLFTRFERGRTSLYRVATVGGEIRKVLEDGSEGDWSPDGSTIGFVRRGSEGAQTTALVGIVPVEGGREKILARLDDGGLFGPRFSPDGRWIAASATNFGLAESSGRFIYLVPVDGGEARRLHAAVEGGDHSAVAWLESGEEIVYFQGESVAAVSLSDFLVTQGASRLVRQRVDTGESRVLLWNPSLTSVIDLAGPGWLIFDGADVRINLAEFDLAQLPGTESQVLSRGSSSDRQPVYTPDGEGLAFSSNRSGNLDIWVRSLKTGEMRRLTDHPTDDWDPAFTRDGRLVWTSRRSGNFEIWMAEPDGTGARQVTHDGVDAENATPTPDGEWLVYNSGNRDSPGVWKIRSDGSEATHLVQGTCQWPEVSPDGRYASYSINRGSGLVTVHVVRIEDGRVLPFEVRLRMSGGLTTAGRTRWMPDGGAIAFTAPSAEGRHGVFVQDFDPDGSDTSASRRPLVVLERDFLAESFGIAPDGSRVTVAGSKTVWYLMSAENLPDLVPPRRGE